MNVCGQRFELGPQFFDLRLLCLDRFYQEGGDIGVRDRLVSFGIGPHDFRDDTFDFLGNESYLRAFSESQVLELIPPPVERYSAKVHHFAQCVVNGANDLIRNNLITELVRDADEWCSSTHRESWLV